MAVSVHSNRLLPIIGGVVILMAVFIGLKSCSSGVSGDGVVLETVPRAPAPDGDTPAETIRTLTARVADMTARMEALSQENAELQRRDREIRESVTREVMTKVRSEQANDSQTSQALAPVMARLQELSDRVTSLAQPREVSPDLIPGSDLPVGLGLEGPDVPSPPAAMTLVWTEPLDVASEGTGKPGQGLIGGARRLLDGGSGPLDNLEQRAGEMGKPVNERGIKPEPTPYYTVPRNATLIGSTGMTALIGRIPIDGQVQDPMPFKIIVGRDNLAANGITIPHVDGMIWSGTAVGDWTLSCVSGRLQSVTFVFEDGTIRTLSSEAADQPLGWISDEQGIPCVSGERITNATGFLANRIGVKTLETAARAAAASESTSIFSGSTGTVTSAITGSRGRYVAGEALADGTNEITRWLDARQGQSFDVVFVRPGERVAIHLDKELAIDYDPNGRKLNHAQTITHHSRRTGLD